MSETEVHQDPATASAKPMSPLMSFAIKVAIIAFAVLLVVHLTVSMVAEEIADTALLKGGPILEHRRTEFVQLRGRPRPSAREKTENSESLGQDLFQVSALCGCA